MFGEKADEIKHLKGVVTELELQAVGQQNTITRLENSYKRSLEDINTIAHRKSELEASVLSISAQVEHKQEEYNTLYKSFQDVAQKNCDLNIEITDKSLELDAAETYLAETQECNEVMHEENSDLVRQLELYKAVLEQLSIVIKPPARRKK